MTKRVLCDDLLISSMLINSTSLAQFNNYDFTQKNEIDNELLVRAIALCESVIFLSFEKCVISSELLGKIVAALEVNNSIETFILQNMSRSMTPSILKSLSLYIAVGNIKSLSFFNMNLCPKEIEIIAEEIIAKNTIEILDLTINILDFVEPSLACLKSAFEINHSIRELKLDSCFRKYTNLFATLKSIAKMTGLNVLSLGEIDAQGLFAKPGLDAFLTLMNGSGKLMEVNVKLNDQFQANLFNVLAKEQIFNYNILYFGEAAGFRTEYGSQNYGDFQAIISRNHKIVLHYTEMFLRGNFVFTDKTLKIFKELGPLAIYHKIKQNKYNSYNSIEDFFEVFIQFQGDRYTGENYFFLKGICSGRFEPSNDKKFHPFETIPTEMTVLICSFLPLEDPQMELVGEGGGTVHD